MKELKNLLLTGLVKLLVLNIISASDVVQEFKEGFIDGYERLHEFMQE